MRTTWQCRLFASAVLGVGVFMLAACTEASKPKDPHGVEHSGDEESQGSEAPPQETDPPTPAKVLLPDSCDALLTVETLGSDLQPFHDRAKGWAGAMLDAQSYAAVTGSEEPLLCGWGIPQSDAIAVVTASVISETERNTLVASFEGSTFADASAKYSDLGAETDHAVERPPAEDLQYITTVLIDGEVLIAVGQTTNGNFALDALRAVQQLNAD